jgi:SAM-dependent methyltransferase
MPAASSYERLRSLVTAHHDRVARSYDRDLFVRALRRAELAALRALLPALPEGAPALDFGAGTGRQTIELLAHGLRVDAFDASPVMREALAENVNGAGRGRLRILASEADIAPRAYTLITCVGVLDYYPDPSLILAQLGEAVAPGGTIVLTFPDRTSPLAWLYRAGSALLACPAYVHGFASVATIAARHGLRVTGRRRSPRMLGGMITFVRLERR